MQAIRGFYENGAVRLSKKAPIRKGNIIMLFPEEDPRLKNPMPDNEAMQLFHKFTGSIDRELVLDALDASEFQDLEDSLQMKCADEKGLDYIITRDINDFKASNIKALPPEDFLKRWKRRIE